MIISSWLTASYNQRFFEQVLRYNSTISGIYWCILLIRLLVKPCSSGKPSHWSRNQIAPSCLRIFTIYLFNFIFCRSGISKLQNVLRHASPIDLFAITFQALNINYLFLTRYQIFNRSYYKPFHVSNATWSAPSESELTSYKFQFEYGNQVAFCKRWNDDVSRLFAQVNSALASICTLLENVLVHHDQYFWRSAIVQIFSASISAIDRELDSTITLMLCWLGWMPVIPCNGDLEV